MLSSRTSGTLMSVPLRRKTWTANPLPNSDAIPKVGDDSKISNAKSFRIRLCVCCSMRLNLEGNIHIVNISTTNYTVSCRLSFGFKPKSSLMHKFSLSLFHDSQLIRQAVHQLKKEKTNLITYLKLHDYERIVQVKGVNGIFFFFLEVAW